MKHLRSLTAIYFLALFWASCHAAEPASKNSLQVEVREVQQISDKNFADKALANGVTVVEFYAVWCGPCRELKPIYEQVCGDCKGAKFYRFECTQESKADSTHNVTKLPTVIVFKDGKEIARKLGHELLIENAEAKFVAWIRDNSK